MLFTTLTDILGSWGGTGCKMVKRWNIQKKIPKFDYLFWVDFYGFLGYPDPRQKTSFPRQKTSFPRQKTSVPRFVHGLSTVQLGQCFFWKIFKYVFGNKLNMMNILICVSINLASTPKHIHVVCPWFVHGLSMFCPWFVHGLSMFLFLPVKKMSNISNTIYIIIYIHV